MSEGENINWYCNQKLSCEKWCGQYKGCVTTAGTTDNHACRISQNKDKWHIIIEKARKNSYRVIIAGRDIETLYGVGLAVTTNSVEELIVTTINDNITIRFGAIQTNNNHKVKAFRLISMDPGGGAPGARVSMGKFYRC